MNKKLTLRKSAVIGFSAMALSMLAASAQALPLITNGSFETTIGRGPTMTNPAGNYDYPGPFVPGSPGMLRTSANIPSHFPTLSGWDTKRSGIACVVFPNTELTQVCGPDRFPNNKFWESPGSSFDGGNYILIDGDPVVSDTLFQTVTGLIVGQSYDVSFYQAAAQFTDATGDTTELWDVSLGGDPTIFTTDGNIFDGAHLLSHKMVTASKKFHPWESQTLRFKVTGPGLSAGDITSQVLGFFAVGTPGGQPPVVLLDGVKITAVPEPETLALLGVGLLGILAVSRQQKKRV